jgi:hypothetical protein
MYCSDDGPASGDEVQLYDVRRSRSPTAAAFNTTLTIDRSHSTGASRAELADDKQARDDDGYVSDEDTQLEYVV